MALARVKTWSAGEILTASDLNAEFNNVLNNARDLVSPLTSSLDMNGFELIMDGDADSSLTADTDDRLDVRLGGVDLFVFNGTTTSCVNGLTLFGTATGTPAYIRANGTDSNTGIDLRDANGNEMLKLAAVASAVNELTVTNASTGNGPSLAATGETNVPITLAGKGTGHVILGQATSTDVRLAADQPIADSSGNELVKFGKTASAVNEITITNAATGNPARVHASGETDVSLQIEPKGTGTILLTDGTDTTKKASLVFSGITNATTRTFTFRDADFTIGTATQAEMETGTSTAIPVTPGRQHSHPGHPKFFVRATANSTTIQESYNVASVEDTATGRMTVNVATDFASTTWCPQLTLEVAAADTNVLVPNVDAGSIAAGVVIVESFGIGDTTEALVDPTSWCVSGFGDQA